ncbi:srs domain-containing protein [Cystoisospora suis]|uniref:Srs domain-containing protein n=1 Tax=Cystoisospora suis TaxID=483139 RepID=A0A2C6K5Q5_9APIC|nr:srs domain-containing protein [Cystoisospora suis]
MSSPKPTTERGALRRGGWLTAGVATALLLLGCARCPVFAQQGPSVPESGSQPSPEVCGNNSGVTSCTCEALANAQAGRAAPKQWKATLSEESPGLELTCPTQNISAPGTMVQGYVCLEGANLDTCLTTQAASSLSAKAANDGSPVQLNTLLAEGTSAVTWKEGDSAGSKKYSMTVPERAFPLHDQQFFVGCQPASPKGAPTCKVSVALNARKTATVGQTVTCAYGSDSNKGRQSVTLTPSENKLTVVCGNTGSIVPAEDSPQCCVYGAELNGGSCIPQAFTSVLPGFERSWWGTTGGSQAILTIPVEKFPAEERKFTLGCKYTQPTNPPGERDQAGASPAPSQPSVCSVDVIITKQPSTTTTTSSTSSASSSVFVAGTSVNVMVALVSLGRLLAVSSLG